MVHEASLKITHWMDKCMYCTQEVPYCCHIRAEAQRGEFESLLESQATFGLLLVSYHTSPPTLVEQNCAQKWSILCL